MNSRVFFSQLSIIPSVSRLKKPHERLQPPFYGSTFIPMINCCDFSRAASDARTSCWQRSAQTAAHSWPRWSYTARFPNNYIPDRARNTATRRRSAKSDKITHEVTLFPRKSTWMSNFNIIANMHLTFLINTWKSSHFSTVSIKDPFFSSNLRPFIVRDYVHISHYY